MGGAAAPRVVTAAPAWIGPRPSPAAQVAIYVAGIIGVLFPGVGPLLLGGLEATGRLSAAQLGQAGTVELLAMGIGAALAGPLFGTRRLRPVTIVAGLLLAALNLWTTRVSGDALTLVRGLAGLPGGVLVWLITGLIVRSPRPAQGAAVYLTVQTLAQLVVVAGLSAFVMGPFGVDGGFVCLAMLGLASAAAGLVVPRAYVPLSDGAAAVGLPVPRGLVALAAAFAFQAFALAAWIYIEPLSRQSGHPAGTAGTAIAVALAAQVAGGTVATLLAGRVSWFAALGASIIVMAALLGVFWALPGVPLFLAAAAGFGFLWIFAAPYLTPLAIEADPSRRAATFVPAASLLGCAAGPFLASLAVSDTDVRGSLGVAFGLAAACIFIVAALHFTRTRWVAAR